MEIRPGTGSISLQVAPASLPALSRAWSAGQVLEALVVRADPAKGTVLLRLPEGEVEARSEIPLQPGARLQILPEASEDGTRLLLRVQVDAAAQTRLAALRQALPRAAALAPLFEALAELLQSPTALPDPVRRAAQALMDSRPTPEALTTPEGLRNALRNGGMELESRLGDPAAPPPAADLKARLLVLLAAIGQTARPPASQAQATAAPSAPPQPTPELPTGAKLPAASEKAVAGDKPQAANLLNSDLVAAVGRHAEGAVARILLHQLQALPDAEPSPQWLFELPLRTPQGNESVLLRFERDDEPAREGAAAAPGWRVTIDLSTPDHGPLRAVVLWRGGELSTRFFAERPATAENLRRHMQALGRRLTAAGIAVGALEAHTGIPPLQARGATSLLSERA